MSGAAAEASASTSRPSSPPKREAADDDAAPTDKAGPASAGAAAESSERAGSPTAAAATDAAAPLSAAAAALKPRDSHASAPTDIAPGSAPYWPGYQNSMLSKSGGPNPRNLPVKRYDGEPLSRADLQHALLCHLFNDTTRCFTNPRPGAGSSGSGSNAGSSSSAAAPTPVYPHGLAAACARPSDETPEELAAWKERHALSSRLADASDEERTAAGLPCAGAEKLTFKELYLHALTSSSRCTKAMREKLLSDEEYAEDFAKTCLLVNIGRINTTLAFYPEMKTILRSYHPLACVQRNENTRRHMQDAPRMKSLLKSVLLDGETPGPAGSASGVGSGNSNPSANAAKAAAAAVIAATAGSSSSAAGGASAELGDSPGTLSDLLAKRRKFAGSRHPVTSIVTILFILTAQANDITMLHFEAPHDFWTLFFPHTRYPVPARQRAKSFLWLIWHYLEGPIDAVTSDGPANPFDDDVSEAAIKDARATRATLTAEPERKRAYWEGAWRGLRNPEWEEWNKKRKAAAAAAATSSTTADGPSAAKKQRRSPDASAVDADGDAQMADTSTSTVKKSAEEEKAAPAAEEELAPAEFMHRILAPHLDVISIPASAAENVDTEEERTWAQEMREERTAFLLRFQAEEGARLAGLDPSKVDLEGGSIRGTPDVGGESVPAGSAAAAMVAAAAAAAKMKQKPGGKRTALPMGGGSSYPLANILAAAKDANGAAGGPGSVAGSTGVVDPEAARLEAEEAARRERAEHAPPNLWELNLRVPAAPNGAARNRNMSSAAHFAAQAASLSLPRIAWRRILERARRGVGEASYESDDDEVAEDEARDERPRGELSRVLRCLRDVRTMRGELERPAWSLFDEDASGAALQQQGDESLA